MDMPTNDSVTPDKAVTPPHPPPRKLGDLAHFYPPPPSLSIQRLGLNSIPGLCGSTQDLSWAPFSPAEISSSSAIRRNVYSPPSLLVVRSMGILMVACPATGQGGVGPVPALSACVKGGDRTRAARTGTRLPRGDPFQPSPGGVARFCLVGLFLPEHVAGSSRRSGCPVRFSSTVGGGRWSRGGSRGCWWGSITARSGGDGDQRGPRSEDTRRRRDPRGRGGRRAHRVHSPPSKRRCLPEQNPARIRAGEHAGETPEREHEPTRLRFRRTRGISIRLLVSFSSGTPALTFTLECCTYARHRTTSASKNRS